MVKFNLLWKIDLKEHACITIQAIVIGLEDYSYTKLEASSSDL